MRRNLAAWTFCPIALRVTSRVCIFLFAAAALTQSPHPTAMNQGQHRAQQPKTTVPALLISDIHFEPFWDPAKVPELAAAPAAAWKAILAAPPSPDQKRRFQSLQLSCPTGGDDTSFALFQSSLKAMRSHAAGAKFLAVSGDLLSHSFDCKYKALLPNSTPDDYRRFVAKTLDYVIGELDASLPGVPVYIALGNNDSDCGDYRLDTHSEFLRVIGTEVTREFPAAERPAALDSFAAGGYYSVSLPAPIKNARLLVLNDIFMASNYATCSGKPDQAESAEQLAWLHRQLTEARANKQKIWVMGHIPPGVNLYSTMKKTGDLCGGQQPAMFLSSETIADELTEFSDVVELAIFAHTHMDELRLLKDESQTAAPSRAVPVKIVSSISPIHGNNPSITLAQIDPSTAALVDYRIIGASNQTGVDAKWAEEYDFARSYHKPEFTSSSVSRIIAAFANDPGAKTNASQSYIEDFSPGNSSLALQVFWPQYVCTLSNHTAQSFKACVCPAAH